MAITHALVNTEVGLTLPYWSIHQEVKTTQDVIIITDLITGGGDPFTPIEIYDPVAWIKCSNTGMEVLTQAPNTLPSNHILYNPLKRYRIVQPNGIEELFVIKYNSDTPANHTKANRVSVEQFTWDRQNVFEIYIKLDRTNNQFDLYY